MSKIIVGLGNPGKQYKNTRHNIGFEILNELAKNLSVQFSVNKKLKSEIAEINYNGEKIILLKPQTFMNLSGEAVKKTTSKFKITPENIWVIYDDVSLNFNTLRIRQEGSAGGHNGVKSIIENLNTDKFIRFRLGIDNSPEKIKLEDWVLGKFTKTEQEKLPKIMHRATEIIKESLITGVENVNINLNE